MNMEGLYLSVSIQFTVPIVINNYYAQKTRRHRPESNPQTSFFSFRKGKVKIENGSFHVD